MTRSLLRPQGAPGFREALLLAADAVTRFDRNPQTDAANWMTDTRASVIGHQRNVHVASVHRTCYSR